MDRFEDMVVWKKAKKLGVDIYNALKESRDWSFNDQIQRAAISISNNIAEGYERKSQAEFIHFLSIAKGSCGEVRSMLHIAKDLNKINQDQYSHFYLDCLSISKMLSNLIKSLSSAQQ